MKIAVESRTGIAALSVLGTLASCLLYSNLSDSKSAQRFSAALATPAAQPNIAPRFEPATAHGRADEFRPSLLSNQHGSGDPKVRLDMMQALDEIPATGGGRDLFAFPRSVPTATSAYWATVGPPSLRRQTNQSASPGCCIDPPHQRAETPPINLKYYGICTTRADGSKQAFFMDGDEILIGAEGQTFKGRYRLLRIGVNSAVVEDIQHKHEQTLPLAEDALPGTGE